LVLQGRNDRLQPITESKLIHEAAAAPKELLLIDTGHLPNLEDPPQLSRILVDWFGRTLTAT
jgi:pimeloyl-ACP methyl ester carboxylesterase